MHKRNRTQTMEPDKEKPEAAAGDASKEGQNAPADALSRTPEDLADEKVQQAAASPDTGAAEQGQKKLSPVKRFFRKVNLYFLIFMLLVVVAGATTAINFFNSQKATPNPNIATQSLTQDALKQLANTDASVGNTSQTLTIQGNAIIAGQSLMRGNLNVAGNLQTGGSIQAPNLTISGTSNLGTAQINSLQVAQNTAIQGSTTLRDLTVAGTASFSGAVTAQQLTVSRLILSGNAVLQVPNHIGFTGPSPSRSMNGGVLGNGGSVSVNGSDTTGTININSGNNPSIGCFARITFQQKFTTPPHVLVSPIGSAAGKLDYYVDRDASGFSICTAAAAQPNQAFAFDYFVTG